jgi:hypothetical protein
VASSIDPRRLTALAKAARLAGITRLRLPDGTEFELGQQAQAAPRALQAVPATAERQGPPLGSLEDVRRRVRAQRPE